MTVSINQLISAVNKSCPEPLVQKVAVADLNAPVLFTKHLSSPIEEPISDVLYLCGSPDLIPQDKSCSIINCILLADSSSLSKQPDNTNLFALSESDAQTNAMLVEKLEDVLISESRFFADVYQMIHEINRKPTIESALETLSKYIPFPIFIIDPSFKLIAKTHHEKIDDIVWKDLQKYGSFSYESFLRSKMEKRFEQMVSARGLLYVCPSEKSQVIDYDQSNLQILSLDKTALSVPRLILNLQMRNRTVAHISILEYDGTFNPYHFRMAQAFKDYLNGTLQMSSGIRSIRSIADSFLSDLLNNVTMSDEFFHARKQIANWKDSEEYYVLSVSSSTSGYKELLPLHGLLQSLVPNSRSTLQDDRLIFLISTKKGQWNSQDHIKKIRSILKNNNLYGGLSYPFKDLRKAPVALEQAVSTAALIEKNDPKLLLGEFADFASLYVLSESSRKISLEDIVHPSLKILIDYDQEKKADLLITLRSFVGSLNNYSRTAEELNIHRNTLDYRIKRICEMTGLDLANEKVIRNLFTSFDILHTLEKL